MIVRCISNTGQDLAKETTIVSYSPETKFNFEIGSIYTVYGICSIENTWDYLFSKGPEEWPVWWPADLFEVIDNYLPPIFYSEIRLRENYKGEKNVLAIFGYKEMVMNIMHHDNLNNRDSEALKIFFKRKAEIDEFEEMRKNRIDNLKK